MQVDRQRFEQGGSTLAGAAGSSAAQAGGARGGRQAAATSGCLRHTAMIRSSTRFDILAGKPHKASNTTRGATPCVAEGQGAPFQQPCAVIQASQSLPMWMGRRGRYINSLQCRIAQLSRLAHCRMQGAG